MREMQVRRKRLAFSVRDLKGSLSHSETLYAVRPKSDASLSGSTITIHGRLSLATRIMNRPSTTLASNAVARSSIARTSTSVYAALFHAQFGVRREREFPIPPKRRARPARDGFRLDGRTRLVARRAGGWDSRAGPILWIGCPARRAFPNAAKTAAARDPRGAAVLLEGFHRMEWWLLWRSSPRNSRFGPATALAETRNGRICASASHRICTTTSAAGSAASR